LIVIGRKDRTIILAVQLYFQSFLSEKNDTASGERKGTRFHRTGERPKQYLAPKQEKMQKYFGGFAESAIFALAI
jgi:hypothetical protein